MLQVAPEFTHRYMPTLSALAAARLQDRYGRHTRLLAWTRTSTDTGVWWHLTQLVDCAGVRRVLLYTQLGLDVKEFRSISRSQIAARIWAARKQMRSTCRPRMQGL